MFNDDTSGETHRSRTLCRIEAVTLATTVAAFAITVLTRGYTVEANPVAAWLLETVGWNATGVIAVVGVGLAFEVFGRVRGGGYGRVAFAGSVALGVVSALDVAADAYLLSVTGYPPNAFWRQPLTVITIMVAATAAVFARRRLWGKFSGTILGQVQCKALDLDPSGSCSLQRGFPRIVCLKSARGAARKFSAISLILVLVSSTIVGSIALAGFGVASGVSADLPNGTVDEFNLNMNTAKQVDGTVFVGSDDGSVYAIDASTGTEEWSFATGGMVPSSPTVVDGTVFVGSDDNSTYAIDASTGTEEWSFATAGSVWSSPTVVDGTVFVGSDDGSVYAIDASTGTEEWSLSTGNAVRPAPTVVDGTVFVGSDDGSVYAIDASTGTEEWSFATADRVRSSPTVVDGTVFVGSHDNSVYAIDASTGTEEWSLSTGNSVRSSPTVVDGTVFVGSDDGSVYAIDASTGTEEWSFGTGGFVRSSPTVVDGTVFVGSYSNSVYAIAASTGTEEWSLSTGNSVRSSPTVIDGTVFVGSHDNSVYAIAASTGTEEWSFGTGNDVYSSPTVVPTGETSSQDSRVLLRTLGHHTGTMGGESDISGQAVNQNDESVANATVEVWAVNSSLTIPSGSSYLEEADKILQNASDGIPDTYPDDLLQTSGKQTVSSDKGVDHYLSKANDNGDAVQVLAHRPEQWGNTKILWDTLTLSNGYSEAGASIDQPRHVLAPGETYTFSCWTDLGSTPFLEDAIDGSWPGQTTGDCTITIEQISPTGEVLDERTMETEPAYRTLYTLGVERKTHHAARTSLPAGIYRVSAEHGEDESLTTWLVVGSLQSLSASFVEDQKDRAGALTARAEYLEQLRQDNTFRKITVEANATGHFSADVPSGYERVAVNAYKGRDGLFTGVTLENRSLTKLRELATKETFNGSVYISGEPQITSVPDDDVTVELTEFTNPPNTDMSDAADRVEDARNRIKDMLQNGSFDISGVTQRVLNENLNASKDELCTLYNEHAKVLRGSQQMWDLWRAQTESAGVDYQLDCAGFGEQKIRDQLAVMYNTVGNGAYGSATGGEGGGGGIVNDVTDGVNEATEEFEDHVNETTGEVQQYFSGVLPWSGDLDEDTTAVFVRFADGSQGVLDEEYWSVNKRAGRPDEIVITDYPMPDQPIVKFDIIAGGDNGGGPDGEGDGDQPPSRGSWTIQNPSFQSEAPTLKSVTAGTLFPAEGQQVSVVIKPTAGSTFDHIESAYVYDASGENVTSTLDAQNNTLTFTAGGPGTHVARLTIVDSEGNQFVERVPLGVAEHDLPMGPVVRARSGFLGVYALAGDGAVDGDVKIDSGTTTISMSLGSRSQNPSVAHVFANELEPAAQEDITVRLLDENGQQISTFTSVNVYVDKLGENALVRRNGDPLTDAVGKINREGDTTMIQTYTGRDGTVNIRVNRDPSYIDRLWYEVDSILVGFRTGGLLSFGDSDNSDTQQAGMGAPFGVVPGLGGLVVVGSLGALLTVTRRRRRGGNGGGSQ